MSSLRRSGSGQSQVSAALGMDFFDYLEQHPSQAREFSAGVGSTTALWAADAAKAIDTTGVKLAVDVGGATGSLLQLLQEANPELRGIVFDRPNIVDDAVTKSRGRASPNAPRSLAATSSSRCRPPTSTS